MQYIRNHWRGNQSLFWSFWINLVVLRIAILFVERFTHPPFTEKTSVAIAMTVAYFTIFQGVVYPWQVLGVIRACDRYLSQLGTNITVLAAQLGIVLSLLVTVIYVAGAFQSLFANPGAMILNQRLKTPPLLDDYTLTLTEGGTRIHLKGDFNIGVTKELGALLDQHPAVTGIIFSSNGGRITEGRGIARLIEKYGLDSYVFDVCKSACTTAFIAGGARILGAKGKLGFHQMSFKGDLKTPYIDPEEEQKIDLAFYARQKIDAVFLGKVFQTPHSDIWFPGSGELLKSGVVHKVLVE